MSVTHHPSSQFRPESRTRKTLGGVDFEELEIDVKPDRVAFKHVEENSNTQLIVLWTSGVAFMLFAVSVIPAMRLDAVGNAIALVVGLIALTAVGVVVQARTRTSTVELSPKGIRVDQGTTLDREVSEIRWSDLSTVELEPVDADDESKGVHLEFRPTQGEPVRAFPGLGIGDLSAVRQAVIKARRGSNRDEVAF